MKGTEHRFVWMSSLKRGSFKKTVFISNVKVGHQSDPEVGSNEVELPGIPGYFLLLLPTFLNKYLYFYSLRFKTDPLL